MHDKPMLDHKFKIKINFFAVTLKINLAYVRGIMCFILVKCLVPGWPSSGQEYKIHKT
jgi:hypothetical protein